MRFVAGRQIVVVTPTGDRLPAWWSGGKVVAVSMRDVERLLEPDSTGPAHDDDDDDDSMVRIRVAGADLSDPG